MKKITLVVVCALFSNFLFSQQWDGPTNSTDPIFRDGIVSIGSGTQMEKFFVNGNMRIMNYSTLLTGEYVNDPSTISFGNQKIGKGMGVKYFPNFEIHNYHTNQVNVVQPMGLYIHPGFDKSTYIVGMIPDDKIALFVSQSKKVGIGTNKIDCSNCSDYKLFVKDGIKTEKVKVEIAASNGWADYVFKDDYKLMSLNDLDRFIKTNGHLPEVPTTEQAIANGIELKEMNILLLKKVEELTLYTLQQQKLIEEQNKRLNALESNMKPAK